MSKNFPPRIPRWTGKISVRILGGNFPSEDSSVDEKKTTEEVVLVKFFVVHGLKVICCLESTEDWQFPSEDAVLSSCGQEFRRKCYRGNTEELMWTGISEKMLPRKHRGAHVDRNFGENVTEEIPFEPPRSSCGQEFPGKYHRGIPFEVRNTVLQARNNSWTAGTNFKSTEVLGGIFPTEALFFFHRGLTQRLCWTGC